MWALIGLLAGVLAGQALWHSWGAVLGGLLGFFIGAGLSAGKWRSAYQKPEGAATAPKAVPGPPVPSLAERVAHLETRMATLEQALGRVAAAEPIRDRATPAVDATDRTAEWVAPGPPSSLVDERPVDAVPAPAPDATVIATTEADVPPPASAVPQPLPASSCGRPAPGPTIFRTWLTGGNALTRVGVVILFFGVAFLLRYFADHFALTIEVKLLGVALAGVVLTGLGLWLARTRAGYGLSLQGAGTGILYLTIYAAFRLHDVLPDQVAVFLLVAVAALTVILALRADSQPLAALAIAGGFLAPILAETHGAPALLFGYFAILNGAIFALAWRRAWRVLNVLGFVFTFALGLLWGARYYAPRHFATVEPFLLLFAAFYVAIVILEGRRGEPDVNRVQDGILVFGVPLVGFALQVELVSDMRYGAAWSAGALALVYGGLFLALRRRAEPGLSLLARAFLALAVIFATLAIPYAVGDQWTGALWAVEAAGVYWMGVAQRSKPARGFALLVELGAGAAFVWNGAQWHAEPMFGNAHFIAAMLIALAGIATAFLADRAGDALSPAERQLTPLPFIWGLAWWFGGGAMEFAARFDRPEATHATLAWVTAGVALALALERLLAWRRLAAAGVALLPVMAWIALRDFEMARTTLTTWGALCFAAAWITQWFVLHALDASLPANPPARSVSSGTARRLAIAHGVSVLALTAQLAWEAGEWTGRSTPAHTAWVACASALPAILYLGLVTRWRRATWWPFATYGDVYAIGAGSPVAALLAVWFVAANVLSPGDASPLRYVPLLNPLEVTLVLSLVALFVWARRNSPLPERALYAWSGVALFVGLNGVVLRTAHHWGDIPWRLSALFASKPLQAALTLTWTVTALALMFTATRRRLRPLWMVGAALLAVVVGKLFLVDLSALSGLPRVVSFLGVGVLLLVTGYLSPLPPAAIGEVPGTSEPPR